jgi:hypothetical protein
VGRSYIVQLAAIEHVERSIRTATVVTFGEGVEPLDLGRLSGMRLHEIGLFFCGVPRLPLRATR